MAKPVLSLVLLTALLSAAAAAKSAAVAPGPTAAVAPGPTAAPHNLTAILEKGGQYTTFLRLLKSTQVGTQLASQINSSYEGMTIFAPTDNAFNNLKPGTLNSLSPQQQVALVLYHVLPRFYSLTTFETASNPVTTQASDRSGTYTVNVTTSTSQVNVSTGVNTARIDNAMYTDYPLAVYSIDKVLLPYKIFGPKPPAAAPEPAPADAKKQPADAAAKAPPGAKAKAADSTAPSAAAGLRVEWAVAVGLGLLTIVGCVF